ncbi:MAG: tetratricopeptide repeat protein [Bacteroidia bacterium]|nr:tetratricopeptide repeat protein [Bacteroidia bacterium]
MKTTWYIFLLFIFTPIFGWSQTSVLDSLINALPEERDSAHYAHLFKIAAEQDKTDRAASLPYYQEAIEIAIGLNDTRKMAEANKFKGVNYLYSGQNQDAKTHLDESTKLYASLGDTLNIIRNNTNIALIFQRMNEYEKATEMYYKVIEDSKSITEWIEVIIAKVNLASLLIDQNDHAQALRHLNSIDQDYDRYVDKVWAEQHPDDTPIEGIKYYLSPEEMKVLMDADPDLSYTQILYPSVYINQGICYKNLEQPDSAFLYLEKAIETSGGTPYITSYAYNNIGEIYEVNEEWDEALVNFREALAGFESINNIRGKIFSTNNVGKALIETGQTKEAEPYLKEALRMASEINFKEEIRDAHSNLAKFYASNGSYKQAYINHELYSSYKDSITNESRISAIQEWETKYDTQKEREEVARLALENEFKTRRQQSQLIIFIFGILFLIGLGLYLYTRYRLKKQEEVAAYERETNQAMAKFVPMEYVRSLGRDNVKDVQLGDQVEKEVTVVFTDIRNFTSISERMTPSENFLFVKRYVERMSPLIHKNGGFINQYLGDGIMAIFQNTPADALRACLDMQEAIKAYNIEEEEEGRDPIKVGMGMHTGMLVMGIIGDSNRKDAAIISDTVNSAARMESLTKSYGSNIILSHESYEKLDTDEFVCRGLGEARVKGKSKPLRIFECLNNENPDQIQRKKQFQKEFDAAVGAYFERDFNKAEKIFNQIYKANPEDLVVYSFLKRVDQYVEDQPVEGLKDQKYNKVN